ncbi:MAG: MFS transporter [Janthinobacterium lividum]
MTIQKDTLPSETLISSKKSWLPWLVWSGAGLFYFYQFILRASPSYMAEELMDSFKVHGLVLGIVGAFYYYAYAPMQIPLGIILDRFGPKRVLLGACFICILGCLCFASAPNLTIACFGRLLMGAGSAGAWIGSIKLATIWFPAHRLGTVIGATMFLGTVGPFWGGPVLADVVDYAGWRSSMFVLSGIGLGLLIFMFSTIRNHESENVPHAAHKTQAKVMENLKKILISGKVWLNAFYAMLMYVPMAVFADLWGVSFIQDLYHIDKSTSARIVSYVFFGTGLGALVVSYFSDQVGSRRIPMFLGALGSLIVYILIIYMPGISMTGMCFLTFFAGFFFSGQLMSFASAVEMVPISSSGVVVGFSNMIIMLSGVIFEPLVGWLLDFSRGRGQINYNLEDVSLDTFSMVDWKFALSSIVICLSLALVFAYFVQETHVGRKKTT